MRTFTKLTLSACIGLVVGVGQAWAGAKPDEINRLSEDLTPMGSERAGNADGTIPEWTGGITTASRGLQVRAIIIPIRSRMTSHCSGSTAAITSNTPTS